MNARLALITKEAPVAVYIRNIAFMIFLTVSNVSIAVENTRTEDNADPHTQLGVNNRKLSNIQILAIMEGMGAASAYLLSTDPHNYGKALMLIPPLIIAASKDDTLRASDYAAFVAVEAIAAYNIKVDKSNTSRSELFRNNLIGWNAILLLGAIFDYRMGASGSNKSKQLSFGYMHEPLGGKLVLSYNF